MTLIENQRYVSLSTWTKDGSQKRTPIWISLLDDGRVGFTTGKKRGKFVASGETRVLSFSPAIAKVSLLRARSHIRAQRE